MKFPPIVHVTWDESNDEPFLIAHAAGVDELDRDGQPVAVYQLVDAGRVSIVKTFESRRRPRRSRRDKRKR